MLVKNFSVRVLDIRNNPAPESEEGYVFMDHGQQYSLLLRNMSKSDAIAAISIDGKEVAHVKVPKKDKTIVDAPVGKESKFTFYKLDTIDGKDVGLDELAKNDQGLITISFLPVPDDFEYKTVNNNNGSVIFQPVYPWWWDYYWWRPVVTSGYSRTAEKIVDRWSSGGASGGPEIGVAYTNLTVTDHSGSSGNLVIDMKKRNLEEHPDIYGAVASANFCATAGGTGLSGDAEYLPEDVEENQEEFKKNFSEQDLTRVNLRLVWTKDKPKMKPQRLQGYSNPVPPPIEEEKVRISL